MLVLEALLAASLLINVMGQTIISEMLQALPSYDPPYFFLFSQSFTLCYNSGHLFGSVLLCDLQHSVFMVANAGNLYVVGM